VVGPGVRVELCWDHTGPEPFGSDLDLHVHRSGTTTDWFFNADGSSNNDDCYFGNCRPISSTYHDEKMDWGYAKSPVATCSNGPFMPTKCLNPRLDIDSHDIVGVPENISIDNPKNGDTFRVMVHYYQSKGKLKQHPIVNVYCAGKLKATYGQTPQLCEGQPINCGPENSFNQGTANYYEWNISGPKWKVADVTATVDAMGNTTDCTVNALHAPGSPGKLYWVTNNSMY
jgi:hypothetical protein